MHSPVRRGQLEVNMRLSHLLYMYATLHDLGNVSSEKALIALSRNDYEPDICFWHKEKTKDFNPDTIVHPVPDFIVEILSKSTRKNDRTIKFNDYAAHGVAEYWMIDYTKLTVEQFRLEKDKYVLQKIHTVGDRIKSSVIAGFEIAVEAIFETSAYLTENKRIGSR